MMRILYWHAMFFFYLTLTCFLYRPVLAQAVAPVVKIGCLYPTTGPAGLHGRDSVVAIQMALDKLNAAASEDAPQFEVLIGDTRSRSLRSLQITRQFIHEDRVDFLCGVVSSDIARLVALEAARADMFFIGTGHASPSLISHDRNAYYFRVNNGSRQSMLAGARYIKDTFVDQERPLKIGFLGPDYELGYQIWRDLRSFLKQQDVAFEVVGEYWPKLFETDYNVYIRHLLQDEADLIVNAQWGLDFVAFVRQAKQLGLLDQTQLANFDSAADFGVLSFLGTDMPEGLILSARHHVNWPDTPDNKAFVQEFFERAGRYPGFAAEGAYSGILAIAKAVETAGGVDDKQKLRQSFETLNLKLPEDPDGFTSFMDPVSHQLMQVQAIGITRRDTTFAPATTSLGDWKVYMPPAHWPYLSIESSDER
ncbi:ABC transporter substrate-binding protein [Epibacterium ulvae]|uniref:ABC transporter substrate-binding protein n=1 Tax=Epibacterium ulvae TaxID=1156985 RepID=UPI002490E503|nr:ABC transporter substrate-binding protein [Epibacterium ulvae]